MFLMAEIRWHFLFFIIVNLGVVPRAQNVKESCVDETSPMKAERFDCDEDGKISYVKMRSGTGTCLTPEGKRCFGLSPPLLVAKLNCYWKSSCIIDWSRDAIIFPENGGDCVGKMPGFLEISYKCFRPDAILVDKRMTQTTHKTPSKYLIDICANLTDKGKAEYELTGSPQLSGMILSHAIYPWDYNNTPRSCIVKVFWPADQKLVVSQQDVELGESDTLQIGNYTTTEIVQNKRLQFPNASGQFNTIFNFSVGSDSNGAKGFVVCFKFTDRGDQSDLSVCDEMTNGGNIHFSEATITSRPHIQSILQTTTKATTVKETPKPSDGPVAINKRCEKKKTEKKKKRCYKKLKQQGGSKKTRKKKNRKNRREKSKRNSDS